MEEQWEGDCRRMAEEGERREVDRAYGRRWREVDEKNRMAARGGMTGGRREEEEACVEEEGTTEEDKRRTIKGGR